MAWPDIDTDTAACVAGHGTSRSRTVSENRITLGDGYSQGAPLGINTTPRSWSLGKSMDLATARTVDSFLEGRNGRPFTWAAPLVDSEIIPPAVDPPKVQVRCVDWVFRYSKGMTQQFSATFIEDFTAPQ